MKTKMPTKCIVNRRFLVPNDRETLSEFNKEYYENLCDFNNSGNVIILFSEKERECGEAQYYMDNLRRYKSLFGKLWMQRSSNAQSG